MEALKSTIKQISETHKLQQKAALMTHVVIGYPSLKESLDIVKVMADSGVSLIELQIPFSDPIADGPTIMYANEIAVAQGVRTKDCLNAVEELMKDIEVPLLLMSYFNPIFRYQVRSSNGNPDSGPDNFFKDAHHAGVQALIVPDVPVDENLEGYWTKSLEHHLIPIPLVAPTTDSSRMKKISTLANQGFVYCVSTTGTTGARSELPPDLPQYLERVRKHFDLPLAVGFGISSPEQVRAVSKHAEIAIVGSATIDLIRKTEKSERHAALSKFIGDLLA